MTRRRTRGRGGGVRSRAGADQTARIGARRGARGGMTRSFPQIGRRVQQDVNPSAYQKIEQIRRRIVQAGHGASFESTELSTRRTAGTPRWESVKYKREIRG